MKRVSVRTYSSYTIIDWSVTCLNQLLITVAHMLKRWLNVEREMREESQDRETRKLNEWFIYRDQWLWLVTFRILEVWNSCLLNCPFAIMQDTATAHVGTSQNSHHANWVIWKFWLICIHKSLSAFVVLITCCGVRKFWNKQRVGKY